MRMSALLQKTSEISKFIVCPHVQRGEGWASADILWTRGEGQFFAILCGNPLCTAPYLVVAVRRASAMRWIGDDQWRIHDFWMGLEFGRGLGAEPPAAGGHWVSGGFAAGGKEVWERGPALGDFCNFLIKITYFYVYFGQNRYFKAIIIN